MNPHHLALLGLNVYAITLKHFSGWRVLSWMGVVGKQILLLFGQIECGRVPGSCPACAGCLSQEESGTLYSFCLVTAVADSGCSI